MACQKIKIGVNRTLQTRLAEACKEQKQLIADPGAPESYRPGQASKFAKLAKVGYENHNQSKKITESSNEA